MGKLAIKRRRRI